jgi:hypothetical protein
MAIVPGQYLKQVVVPGIWRKPGGADGTGPRFLVPG